MRKMLWTAVLFGALLLFGSFVTAQETTPQPAMPQMQGTGSMKGKGVMGREGQSAQMRQMGSGMEMMQGMMQGMDACAQMMGTTPSSSQEPKE